MVPDFSFTNQRVVILGLARQGLALARFFCDAGAKVTVSDRSSAEALQNELEQLANLPIEYLLGDHPLSLLDECDLLCLSGGVPPQIEIVQEAIRRGIPLSNDMLLTMQLAKARGLGPIVAITGSSGKTTTTTLVGEMLRQMGQRVHVGGNIGVPLLDKLSTIHAGEFIVLELSSFQLELFDPAIAWDLVGDNAEALQVGPDVAAIVNITPNHLDRHADMAEYTSAKFNLLRALPSSATVVLNADDPVVSGLISPEVDSLPIDPLPAGWALDAPIAETRDKLGAVTVVPFSQKQELASGASIKAETNTETDAEKTLVCNGHRICLRAEIRLRGAHNVSNILAAAAISEAAVVASGRSNMVNQQERNGAISTVASTFAGVPHRLEVVAEANNVQWINDSIATSPERTVAGLRSFDLDAQVLILLIGGKDKNLSWEALADEVNHRVDHLIGFGEVGPSFVELVQEQARFARTKAPNTAVVNQLGQAVKLAAQFAKSKNAPSTAVDQSSGNVQEADERQKPIIVLLSPGGTSYDAYKDFEARGNHFRELVEEQLAYQANHTLA